jgi:hypothetical protein
MGACLSCLYPRPSPTDATDRSRLLYDDYPHNAYGTWGGHSSPSQPPPDHGISADEERRLQTAWDGITTWAGNQIVEIFPSQQGRAQGFAGLAQQHPHQQYQHQHQQVGEGSVNGDGAAQERERERLMHQDILLSMIPGDKSKRSIRIYPSSRPGSRQTESVDGKNGEGNKNNKIREKASGIFVKLNVNLP